MYICVYCNYASSLESDFEVDHVYPQSRFPHLANVRTNLRISCSGCNRQKGDKTGQEYFIWRQQNFLVANKGPVR